MKKPNMSLPNRGSKKSSKLVTYIKAILILSAVFYLSYQVGRPVLADAPVRCTDLCGGLPEAKDKGALTIPEQIIMIAREHNFQWEDYLIRLADCESNLKQYATNMNGGKSLDRGVFQINKYWHGEVPDECAFNIRCSTEWTMERINKGYQHEWMCDKLI